MHQLKTFQTNFELEITKFLQEFDFYNPTSKAIFKQLQEITLAKKSKRLRPFLVQIGYDLYAKNNLKTFDNKDNKQNLINLQLALEFFQAYCLIHDDIIDNSKLRRGIKTIHFNFQEKYQDQNKGISAGILGGDLSATLADISFNRIQTENFFELAKIYGQMKLELMDGQIDDVFETGLADLENLTENQILKMIDYKSGRYSIQKPLLLGAILAGKKENELEKISLLGKNLGLIFQLTDDLLGAFGKTVQTGKPDISDILEGKKTLLMLLTFKNSNENEKKLINSILGNPKASLKQIQDLKNLIQEKKADQKIKQKCQEINQENQLLLNSFQDFDKENSSFKFLIDFSDYLLQRNV